MPAVWFLLVAGVLAAKFKWSFPEKASYFLFFLTLLLIIGLRVFDVRESLLRLLDASLLPVLLITGKKIKGLNSLVQNKFMLFVGSISYSLYLWQQLATGPWLHHVKIYELIMVFIVLILISWTSKNVFEDRLKGKLYTVISKIRLREAC